MELSVTFFDDFSSDSAFVQETSDRYWILY